MTALRYVDLYRGLVSITGADRRDFLQGLISQNIERVSATQAAYGAFLTPQGKYLHDFCLVEFDDRIILDGEAGRADELLTRIKRFRLRAKVELAVADNLAVYALFGDDAPAALGLAAQAGAARALADGVAFVDPRSASLGCRLIAPPETAAPLIAKVAPNEAAFADYDALRIKLGIPDGTRDMDVDKSTLLECNFDSLNGIDWEKGCYIGQEVTARTKYRGLQKRRLVAVSVAGPALAPGTEIRSNGAIVGKLLSIQDGIALASLRLDAIETARSGEPLTANGAEIVPLSSGSGS